MKNVQIKTKEMVKENTKWNNKQVMEVEKDDGTEVKYRGWKVMPFIIGNEVFEKVGIIGTMSNLLIYLTNVFNLDNITAATIISVFSGTTNFGTFVAAFISDTYLGRYKTLGVAVVACFLGALSIELTSAIPSLHPPACAKAEGSICTAPTSGQISFLLLGLGLLIVGAGGIRPCNLPFGADQFNPKTESGKKGIDSFFNWYFFTFSFAQVLSLTLIVYIQSNVSWTIGLAIPAALMLFGCIVYFAGSKLYVKVKATGSPLLSVVQVFVVALKKSRLEPLKQPSISLYNYIPTQSDNSQLDYTDQFRFFDKAAILTPEDEVNADGSPQKPWSLCSMQQVEEFKCLLRVIPIWLGASIYFIVPLQHMTYGVFQALQMDRRVGNTSFEIPGASYVVFLMGGFTIFIPIYAHLFVPLIKKITGKPGGITNLQRIGIGLAVTIVSMLVSAVVEERRRTVALTRPTLGEAVRRGGISSLSAFWLVPQLLLSGVAEAFTGIGQVEFYYKQFPENMRSVAGSLYYCGLGMSSYLSGFLTTTIHEKTKDSATGNWLPQNLNKGRLDYFYYTVAGIELVNFVIFLVFSNWYKYKGSSSNTSKVEVEVNKGDKESA